MDGTFPNRTLEQKSNACIFHHESNNITNCCSVRVNRKDYPVKMFKYWIIFVFTEVIFMWNILISAKLDTQSKVLNIEIERMNSPEKRVWHIHADKNYAINTSLSVSENASSKIKCIWLLNPLKNIVLVSVVYLE